LAKIKEKIFIVANHVPVKKAECPRSIFIGFALDLFHESRDLKKFMPTLSFAHWFG
jgi:hypothetical protein